jgi:hypothetical protein
MKQAMHIFRKDVSHLWPQIAIVLMLVAAFTVSNIQSSRPAGSEHPELRWLAGLLGALVPVGYAWLIVTLVHQEPLPGDRQFWLTRPYRRGSLLVAKVLFVLLFVSATMVAKDCFIVAGRGFPVIPNITGLLLRQFAWTAWVVLPALAVGVVTHNLQDVGLVGALVGLVYALQGALVRKSFWPGIEWVRDYFGMLLLLTLCAAIMLWQYLRRETGKARVAVAFCSILVIVGLPLLSWNAAFTVQMLARGPRLDLAKVQIRPNLASVRSAVPAAEISQAPIAIVLPLRLTGLPSGMMIVPDGTNVAIASGQRVIWRSGWQQNWYGMRTEQYHSQVVYIDIGIYRSLQNQPVTIRLSLGLTLLENGTPSHVPAHQERFAFGGSRCEELSPEIYPPPISCLAALKAPPRTLVALEAPGAAETISQAGTWSYAPYEALLDQSPLAATSLAILQLQDSPVDSRALWERPDAQIVLTPQRPVAHFRRDLEFPGVRLVDYVLPPGRAILRAVP